MNVSWEEQFMPDKIGEFHEKAVSSFSLPEWANIDCPHCGVKLPIHSIRTIGLKFNTRNIGDVVVEVMCDECKRMDVVYFRNAVPNINDFCSLLKGEEVPSSEPLVEEKMYEQNYNNLLEMTGVKIEKSGFVGDIEKGG